MMIGAGAARGAVADTLSELIASFDGERQALGVPSISVALVEDGRISLAQRGVESASTGAPVGPRTRYQAASMSKTVAAITAPSLSIACWMRWRAITSGRPARRGRNREKTTASDEGVKACLPPR